MKDHPPERILIIRPSALGDVCRSVPVLASLRAAFPQSRIDWVVQDDFAAAIAAHPALDELVHFPRSRFAHWWKRPGRGLETLNWFRHLRSRGYELVIDCQGLGRSGLMTYLTRARMRVGLQQAREFAWLSYNIKARSDALHTVDRMLALVEAVGVSPVRDMRLYVAPDHEQWWLNERGKLGRPDFKYAVIAPSSRWPSKRWPIERFAQLVEPLLKRSFDGVVVIGSPSEVAQVKPLFESEDVRPLTTAGLVIDQVGKASIGQTMAVISNAGLVIANDSAPLHMAVGFDRPCVGLFGPTDPAIVGPYQREHAVLRGYAAAPGETIDFKDSRLGDRYMRFISTAAVLQKIDAVLANWRSAFTARSQSESTQEAVSQGAAR
jgi:heptosyltransferase I